MKITVNIPGEVARVLRAHLFKSDVEEAAFLFARASLNSDELRFDVDHLYPVPSDGWDVQHALYLEMKDNERAKIMKMARGRGAALVESHAHPGWGRQIRFSPSDLANLPDFATYVKWKLDGKPFAALVWSEQSVDGLAWYGDFSLPAPVDQVIILSTPPMTIVPTAAARRGTPTHTGSFG